MGSEALTRREAEVLAWIATFREMDELIYERGKAYFGHHRIGAGLVMNLIRNMYISATGSTVGSVEHYHINETGLAALKNHLGID